MRVLVVIFSLVFQQHHASPDTSQWLLLDRNVKIDATQAVNDLYNFKFEKAEQQFRWLKQKYGWHPLPYFLHGLSEWWKITPNIDIEDHDQTFYAYMDTSIYLSRRLYDQDKENIEAAFFLAASYAFKGRLLSERKNWRKAALAGKNALKFLEISRGHEAFSPELLLGDALYNYYSVWINENYPLLKPILMFFPKGDKELGIEQLRKVATNAFYTRTEAQFFLMRILASEGEDMEAAVQVSEYLFQTFPDNPYFHRYYARLLYSTGKFKDCEKVSLDIITKIDEGQAGYEQVSGRYAGFFLGQIYQVFGKKELSRHFYERSVNFTEEIGHFDAGYYLNSLMNLAHYAKNDGEIDLARDYMKKVKKHTKKKSKLRSQSKEFLKDLNKEEKAKEKEKAKAKAKAKAKDK